MKDRIITNNLRNIKKSFLRFLSLLVMAALGVFAFTGLMAVAPDMIDSLDRFLDERKNYDLKVISDLGLDKEDVAALERLPSVEKAEGVLYRDSPVVTDVDEGLVNINSLPKDINLIEITSGRMPQSQNEIAVEANFLKANKAKIGDKIHIDDEEGFYETDVYITGVVDSPLFYNAVEIDNFRGNTNVGSGTINYYAYAPESNFKADYISTIYATVKGATDLETGSDEYNKLIEKAMDEVEGIRDKRQRSRYDTIMKQADEKIEEGSAEAKEKLEDAKRQLEDAKRQLESAALTISEGEEQLNGIKEQLDSAAVQLETARTELADKEKELEDGRKLLEDAGRQIGEKEAQLNEARRLLDTGFEELTARQAQLEDGKSKLADGKKQLDEKQKLPAKRNLKTEQQSLKKPKERHRQAKQSLISFKDSWRKHKFR